MDGAGSRLAGRVAVITGGGSGIGRAIALGFAQEGAHVAILDRDHERGEDAVDEIAARGGTAAAFACDVSCPEQIEVAVEAAAVALGPIDVLVNNAGITTTAPLADLTLELWEQTIAIDLTGAFLMTRAVAPAMIARGTGRIINIASQLGLRGAPDMAHYCAAKAGVLGLTRALARELISAGIRVNAVAPGPTYTDNLAGVPAATLDGIRAELPIGRFARVEEIVPTVVMLASSDGDFYVGATLNVSGGHVM